MDSGFAIKYYNHRVVNKDENRLRKRGWAIRDRLVVPFRRRGNKYTVRNTLSWSLKKK